MQDRDPWLVAADEARALDYPCQACPTLRAELEEERAQRIHEARLAREAIGHLRAVKDWLGAPTEQGERAAEAACEWLDSVKI